MKRRLRTVPTKSRKGEPIVPTMSERFIRDTFRQIGGAFGFLQQLAENSFDAFANYIKITIDPSTKIVIVEDDGRGMGPQGRHAFVSLGESYKEDKKRAKGRHGTGAKSVFGVANSICVEDRSVQDGSIRAFRRRHRGEAGVDPDAIPKTHGVSPTKALRR